MAGRPVEKRNKPHRLAVDIPAVFWKEIESFYKKQKSYNSYGEMARHLMKVGMGAIEKVEENGELNSQAG